MNRTTRFRRLLEAPEILQMPCCHDGLSARILEQAGFEAIAAAGFGLSGSLLGQPDIGLLTASEMLEQYRRICLAVDLPVFVDVASIVAGFSLETGLSVGGNLPETTSFGGNTATLGGSAKFT
ncbi:MAG: isocitrate lyase/phosphoenolpyruvate mutase family protein, partial [Cyanobacteriota bacterium]